MRTGPRKFGLTIALVAALVLSLLPAALAAPKKNPPKGGTVELQILQYSDWHGQLDPLSVFGEGVFGGAAELATYFRMEEANNPNTLIITGGDDFGASPPLANFFDEAPAVLAQNLMGTDVSALGNHNFDKGVDHLQEMVNTADYAYLGANLEDVGANVVGVAPYKIFHFPGIKVAVIGVTNEEAPELVFPGSFGTINITDAGVAAQKARDKLAKQGVDVFILVAHDGLRTSTPATGELIDLANSVSGFDLVLGDHTDIKYSDTINGALVVENRSRGRTYARISLEVKTGNGGVTSKSVTFVDPVSADVEPAADVVALLQPYRDALGPILNVQVGESSVAIPRSDSCGRADGRLCESLVGNVVTDAMRSTYGTDFAITNSGGLRSSLTCPTTDLPNDFCPAFTPPPYPITRGQVLTVLPFGNFVVTFEATGGEVKQFLENAVSAIPGANGRYGQVSGLCFTFNADALANSRVTSAVRQAADGSCTGAAVDFGAGASYTVAINDFMATGGDGYPVVFPKVTSREIMDQVLADYVTANPALSPSIQGRITCESTATPSNCPTPLP